MVSKTSKLSVPSRIHGYKCNVSGKMCKSSPGLKNARRFIKSDILKVGYLKPEQYSSQVCFLSHNLDLSVN